MAIVLRLGGDRQAEWVVETDVNDLGAARKTGHDS